MALSKDITSSPGRAGVPAKINEGGKVLDYVDFSDGFGGYDQHYGGFVPNVPLGLTTRRTLNGKRSLLLTGGERPYGGSTQTDKGTTAYKRLALFDDDWTAISLSMYFGILGSEVLSWSSISMGFDIQAWDNADRGHFRCELQDGGNDTVLPRWKILKNDDTPITVPSSTGHVTGENENKAGLNFASLKISRTPTPGSTHNGGQADTIGSYAQLQSNNTVYDLSGLGAGQGWQDPQDGDPIGDFRGGFNPGVGAFRSTRKPNTTFGLIVDSIWVTVWKD